MVDFILVWCQPTVVFATTTAIPSQQRLVLGFHMNMIVLNMVCCIYKRRNSAVQSEEEEWVEYEENI